MLRKLNKKKHIIVKAAKSAVAKKVVVKKAAAKKVVVKKAVAVKKN